VGGYRGYVRRIAIAGGIGAGKTVVTDRLSGLGWPVIDADVVARQIVEPGAPAWRSLRDAFGDAVLNADRSIDRTFLADVVFHDPTALRRLNCITHGYIGAEIVRQLDEVQARAVFVALPLFRPEHRGALGLDEVWAVEVEPETAVARLRDARGFSEADARARLAAQISNDEREALVDRVLWNQGTLEELFVSLARVMDEIGLGSG
jgi:dephospho-CoA kinase